MPMKLIGQKGIAEMKQSTLYSRLWYVFVMIYIVHFAMQEVLPARNFLHDHLSFIYTLVGVMGVLLLLVDFVSKRRIFRLQGTDILVLFFIMSMVSTLVNFRYGFTGNVKCLLWMAIQIFLLSALDPDVPKETHVKRLCVIFDVFIFLWLLGVLWALWQYLLQDGGYIETIRADRVQSLRIGFMDGRLHGMFEDPNYAAIASQFAIGLAVFCLCWGKRPKAVRVYYGITIVLQIFYIILSGSRSGVLAAMATVSFGLAFIVAAKTKRNRIIKAVSFLLAGVLSATLFFGAYKMLQTGLSYLPYLVGMSNHGTIIGQEDPVPDEIQTVDFTRDDVVNKKDYSNGRFSIWADYLKVLKTTPMFGTGPRSNLEYAKYHFENLFIIQRKYINVHNAYLALFVGVGLVGGGIMTLWIIRVIVLILGYLIRRWTIRDEDYWRVFLLTLLVLMMGVAMLTSQGIFFFNLITDILFWLVLGTLLYLIRETEPERNRKQTLTAKLCDQVMEKFRPAEKQARSIGKI